MRTSIEPDAELISIDDAAVEIGWAKPTVWKWVRIKQIPTFRVPGERRTMIRRADLATLREPIPIDPEQRGKEAA